MASKGTYWTESPDEQAERDPGVNQGRRRGTTKSAKPKKRKNR